MTERRPELELDPLEAAIAFAIRRAAAKKATAPETDRGKMERAKRGGRAA